MRSQLGWMLLLILWAGIALAQVDVSLQAPAEVTVGDVFEVQLMVSQVADLDTTSFTLDFDNSVIQLLNVHPGALMDPASVTSNWSDGTAHVVMNHDGTDGATGSGVIAVYQFQAFRTTSFSDIMLSNLLLGNSFAEPIPVLTGDPVRVNVIGTPPQVQVSLDALAEADQGATIDVFLNISAVSKLDTVDFRLAYPPTVLQYLSATVGNTLLQGTNLTVNVVPGEVHGVLNLPGVDGFEGEGSLVHLQFSVIGLPGSQGVLSVSSLLLGDVYARLIDAIPGAPLNFTVSGELPEPVTVSLLTPQAVQPGGIFIAYVQVAHVLSLDVASLNVQYDPSVLQVRRVLRGNLMTDTAPLAHVIPPVVQMVVNNPGTAGVSGTGTLVGVEFEAISGVGTGSSLALTNVILGDTQGRPIPARVLGPRLVNLLSDAPAAVTVGVQSPTSVDEAAYFDAAITVTEVNQLDTVSFALTYDPGVLGVAQVVSSGLLNGASVLDNTDTPGLLQVVLNLGELNGASGSGSIGTVRFQAIGAMGDHSDLSLMGVLLGDISAAPIPLTIADPLSVYIGPRPFNNPPVANAQSVSVDEDGSLPITLTGNDPDGDPLTFSIVDPPTQGTLVGTAPDVQYTPNPDYHGPDQFTFKVHDGSEESTPAKITITITPVNDPPTAQRQSVTTDEDTPLSIILIGNDVDGDRLSFQISTAPSNGSLSGVAPNLTYTPQADYYGEDSFGFTVHDGTVTSDPGTVAITVEPITDPPIITAGPEVGQHLIETTVTFQWEAYPNDPNPASHSFSYRLDDAPFSDFSSETTHTYTGLTEGSHTFMIRAQDPLIPEPSKILVHHFGIDLTPPDTQRVAGPSDDGYVKSTSVTFQWRGTDNLSAPAELLFAYQFDGGDFTDFTAETSHTFDGLANGEQHTFSVKAKDKAGHVDPTPLTITFTVDTIPPDTSITTGPEEGSLVASRSVAFEWTGSDDKTPVGQLQFSHNLDVQPFQPFAAVTSYTLTGLSDGLHTFNVKARDLAGNEDPTAATRHFTVDGTSPSTTITSGPGADEHITTTTVDFSWAGTDNHTSMEDLLFSYRLDEADYSGFASDTTVQLTGLTEGYHTFEVRAKDEAGNIESTARRRFAVDLSAPDTHLISGPTDGGWGSNSPTFVWGGTDNVSTEEELLFSYKFDDGDFTEFAAVTTQTFVNLSEGEQHTFVVKAKDKAGYVDSTPLTITFTVDTTPPDTQITAGPDEGQLLTSRSISFEWTGSDDQSSTEDLEFAYRLDNEPSSEFSAATSHTLNGVSDGTHTFSVKARDLATNEDTSPETRSFEVDATPPTITITVGPSENQHLDTTTAAFEWSATDNRTPADQLLFSYSLDSGVASEFGSETSLTLTGLSEALHTFQVQAKDGAGLIGTVTRNFGVDLTPPDTQWIAGPTDGGIINTSSVTFRWTGTDNLAPTGQLQFAYKLNSADYSDFSPATSRTFTGLGEENHTFAVKARDKAGHEDPTPLETHFTVAFIDLLPVNITAPYGAQDAWSGQSIEITWDVANNGSGAALGDWYDRVYLSDDTQIGSDTLLGEFRHTSGLPGGSTSYSNTQSVILPAGVSGSYWIIVEADGRDQIPEENAEANNLLINDQPILVNFTPPPDLQVTSIATQGDAWPGRQIYVGWTVSNLGSGRAPGTWQDRVFLSPDAQVGDDYYLGTFTREDPLDSGQSYTFSRPVTLPNGISGDHWIIVMTDWTNAVYEHDTEDNNTRVSDVPISVQRLPYPDLTVTAVSAPSEAFADLDISLSWTVTNQGDGSTDAPFWYDHVYLSLDVSYDGSDIYLGSAQNASYLDAGEGYVQTAQFRLPREIAGVFYVLIWTDSNNYVQEHSDTEDAESNNWGSSPGQVQVQLPPKPDLQVTQVDAPATGRSGQDASLTWQVANKGDARTDGSRWYDAVFLSEDTQLSQDDVHLGTFEHEGELDVDASYTQTQNVTLPIDRWGDHYLFVQTDSNNHIYEQLWENNNTGHDQEPISITLSPPADLEATALFVPGTGSAGNPISVDWTVANNGGGITSASSWWDAIYLSEDDALDLDTDTLLGQFTHSESLDIGASYSENRSVTLPKAVQGAYHLILWTDSEDDVFEYEWEGNNRRTASLQVLIGNLEIASVNVPPGAASGSSVEVSWTVTNIGEGKTDAPTWTDSLYLSTDTTFDSSTDTLLGTFTHSDTLDPGGEYTVQEHVTLPKGLEGSYYVIAWTDSGDAVFESPTVPVPEGWIGENLRGSSAILITLNQADLQVTDVQSPSTGTAGQSLMVQWSARNVGPHSTGVDTWKDAVYLSEDTQLQPAQDVLLDSFEYSGALNGGQQYTRSQSCTIPLGTATGNYYVLVQADSENGVDEHNAEDNNVGSSATTVQVVSATPDLQVTQVDAPATGIAGHPISVSWTVTNRGGAPNHASYWTDSVYLSTDTQLDGNDIRLGQFSHYGSLAAGGSYPQTQQMPLPQAISGSYYMLVWTDVSDEEEEFAGEDNNVGSDVGALQVTFAPPDLQVTDFQVPGAGWAGQSIHVGWTVSNQGTGETTTSSWYDKLYFSRDMFLDNTDEHLGYRYHSGSLAAGSSYTDSLDVTLPIGASGPAYLILFTDSNNRVYEYDREDNNTVLRLIEVSLLPPADLIVSQVIAPVSGVPGQAVEIGWTVTNQGGNDAIRSWWDSVYLSTDVTWDINDAFAGNVQHNGTVVSGGSYAASINVPLPGVLPGDYFVIARTDIRNQVNESDNGNNQGVSASLISMDVMELTLGVPYQSQLSTGTEHYYKVNVPAGEDLQFTLDCDSAEAATELYVRYGSPPTRSTYDYAYDQPWSADQKITVPSTQAGDYYILVTSHLAPTPSAYNISTESLQFSIQRITPNAGGNTGKVTIRLFGAGFRDRMQAKLARDGHMDVHADKVEVDSSSSAKIRFDLTGIAEGLWNVTLTREDGKQVTAEDLFMVEPGTPLSVDVTLYGPESIRAGRPATYYVLVKNRSNVDAERVIVQITSPFDNNLTVKPRRLQLPNGIPPYPNQQGEQQITLITGDISPGESSRLLELEVTPANSYSGAKVPMKVTYSSMSESDFAGMLYNKVDEQAIRALQDDSIEQEIRDQLENRRLWNEEIIPKTLEIIYDQIQGQYGYGLAIDAVLTAWCISAPPLGCAALGVKLAYDLYNLYNDLKNLSEIGAGPRVLRSKDPNDKIAPAGSGTEGFVSSGQILPYTINFENVPDATAPAEQVSVTDPLDADLDWRSFRLGELAFGDTTITVPENRSIYQTRLTLDSGMLLDIDAGIDIMSGELRWLFRTIDPATGQPPVNPSLGFLPPNDGEHSGEGHVTFTIKPKSGMADGTEITNKATIVFDTNEAIDTNVVRNVIHNVQPDLMPLSFTVQSQRNTLIEGEDCTLTATIQNNSDVDTGAFQVHFFDGNPDTGGTQVGSAQSVSSLLPQATQEVEVTWVPIRLRGERQVFVSVDPGNAIGEVNELNNVRSSSLVLQPRSFTLNLERDINLVSVPLEPAQAYTARSLSAALGATMLVRYNPDTAQFEAFLPDFHTTDGFSIEGSTGYIAILDAPKSVTFEGISRSGTVHVRPDINMLGLPLRDETTQTARSFSGQLGADMLIRYNHTTAQFEAFLPDFHTGGGFDIEGGKAYIAITSQQKEVTFVGKGWLDEDAPLAVPPMPVGRKTHTASVFGVAGYLYEEDGKTPATGRYQITLTNKSTGDLVTIDLDATNGQYAVAFVDLHGESPISKGDRLEAIIRDTRERTIGSPLVHAITPEEIKKRYALFHLTLPREIPDENRLGQNFPNPFNPDTWIPYQLAEDATVTVEVYNTAGQLVRTLNLGSKRAGYYAEKRKAAYWDGRNDSGEATASGMYFYTIRAGEFHATKKMVVLK